MISKLRILTLKVQGPIVCALLFGSAIFFEGYGYFFNKLETQLAPTTPETKQLAAEMLWVMFLCPGNITAATKRNGIQKIWEWSGEDLNTETEWLTNEVLRGVGSAGTAYNTSRWRELMYFIRIMIAFKKLVGSEREELLTDVLKLAKWLEQIPENETRQFRHMMLFLLFPDEFERIFGGTDRRKIVVAFTGKTEAEVNTLSALDIDNELAAIRNEQEQTYDTKEIDFYNPPLRDLWGDDRNVTWLMSWNPNNWPWETLDSDREATHAGKTVTLRWACANRKAAVGDKAYLVRTGVSPKGIIATGNIVTAPFQAPHYDETKSAEGKTQWYVDIAFTRIQDPLKNDPYITVEDLSKITIDNQVWAPQSSGIEIKERSAGILQKQWEKVVEKKNILESILGTAKKVKAGLIVMSTEGRHGFLEALRGSQTEQVIGQAPCPVLAVPAVGWIPSLLEKEAK